MDKDEIRAIVDDLFNERDLRMDDLFNRLQQVTRDLELVTYKCNDLEKRLLEAENGDEK
tara:strand:- start:13797 stop:13973 length:177 start_codon:yes stop_codon:yes gene_type:complete